MSDIVARECRFVFHRPASENNEDTHIIKELLHYKDGSTAKNLRILKNFKRPFWTTKEHMRNHKDKKESELLDNVLMDMSAESDLARAVGVKLGSRYVGVNNLRTIRNSPYVYGLDINSRTYIKQLYQDKYDIIPTPYEVAVLDIETNTLTNELTILSITTKTKCYVTITKQFLQTMITTSDDPVAILEQVKPKLDYLYKKHIPETDISKNMKVEYVVTDNELDSVLKTVAMLHKWEPDFVAVWNITYDVPKMLDILKKNNIDPAKVMSSPKIPDELKYFKFKLGQTQKVTASGKVTPISIEQQWHTVDCPASFYWIDAMSAHRFIRIGGKTVPGGYGLDNILKHELGDSMGKLKFDDPMIESTKGIEWHQYMTASRPLEYIIYNIWDTMSVLTLDEKTNDLQIVLPMLSGVSNFDIFNSGPKRIVDALHFFYLEKGRVLGTKSSKVDDKESLGLGEWIVLLPSYRIADKGLPVLDDDLGDSNVRGFCFDADQVSGYPSNTRAANVSLDTTLKELISIEGMSVKDFRTHNINMLFGKVNALSYGTGMLNLPTAFELMKYIDEEKK